MSSTVTAKQIETLNHALAGFKWLKQNHEASVMSAEVEVDGDVFKVERNFDFYDEDDEGKGELGVLTVEFE